MPAPETPWVAGSGRERNGETVRATKLHKCTGMHVASDDANVHRPQAWYIYIDMACPGL